MSVIIYTTDHCAYCMRAKQLLTQRRVPFKEIHVDQEDDAQWEALFKKSGMRTMPQLFHEEKLIGGYSQLADLDREDQLESLK